MKKSLLKYIDPSARFFLYTLIFWLPYSIAVVESSVITAVVLWLAKRFLSFDKNQVKVHSLAGFGKAAAGFFKLPETFLNLPILFFVTACFLSIATSVMPEKSWHGFITKTMEWFVVYFLIVEFMQTRRQIKIAVFLFIFSALATCLDGIIQFHFTGTDLFLRRSISGLSGATAAFHTYNILGGYLTFVLPVVISLFFVLQKDRKGSWGICALFLITVWGLAVTLSRGAWAASVLGILFFLFFKNRKWMAVALLCVVLSAIGVITTAPEYARTEFRADSESFQGTVRWRLGVWEDSLKTLKHRPLTGYGLNTFMDVFQKHRRQGGGNIQYPPTYAHNGYVQIAFETGILGLLAFLWIVIRLFRETIGKFWEKVSQDHHFSVLLMGLLSAVFASLIHNCVDTDLYSLQLSVLLWYMIGMTVSVYKLLNTSGIHAIK